VLTSVVGMLPASSTVSPETAVVLGGRHPHGALRPGADPPPELDGVLRERGRELGIAEGSRLDQAVRAEEIDWRLLRWLDIDHGPRMRSGPSLGNVGDGYGTAGARPGGG
jgi:hypothetical protein